MESALLTTGEVARRLNVKPSTVVRWILGGKLPAVRVVGRYRVRESDLDLLVEPVKARKEQATAKQWDSWTDRVLREAGI